MTPTNNSTGKLLFLIVTICALAFFSRSMSTRAAFIKMGQPDNRLDKPLIRAFNLLPWVVGNLRVARPRYWYSGVLHTFILWGF